MGLGKEGVGGSRGGGLFDDDDDDRLTLFNHNRM